MELEVLLDLVDKLVEVPVEAMVGVGALHLQQGVAAHHGADLHVLLDRVCQAVVQDHVQQVVEAHLAALHLVHVMVLHLLQLAQRST